MFDAERNEGATQDLEILVAPSCALRACERED
jgi:hypothetical protein